MMNTHETRQPHPITDWDDAYANSVHIQNSDRYRDQWLKSAAEFRNSFGGASDHSASDNQFVPDIEYGKHPRQRYDLFTPSTQPLGLMVFVHGGYWMALDKSYWSHLANGALLRGYAVVIPSYVLCPEAGIADIVCDIAKLITKAASTINGPIVLSGHSAGGHLVSSMLAQDAKLGSATQQRIKRVMSISGVHDLRPLLNTTMNEKLQLDSQSASELSPVLQQPVHRAEFVAWVGADERPEFVRQTTLISSMWHGLGLHSTDIIEPGKHHFNVIDALADPDSDMLSTLLS